jgi:hypothetical protein
MRDEMDARIWNEHGHQFSEDLHRFFQAVKVTFCKIAAINFSAPWRKPASRC